MIGPMRARGRNRAEQAHECICGRPERRLASDETTIIYAARACRENWRPGLAALMDRPAALFHLVGAGVHFCLWRSTASGRQGQGG
jgi:hypothetical protein